jgi:hypothetical protein
MIFLTTGEPLESIMLLRHSNQDTRELERRGGSVEEYTIVQPNGTQYDLRHPARPDVHFLVAIVEDKVFGVYKIEGVEKDGTTYDLVSEPNRKFDIDRKLRKKPGRRYAVTKFPGTSIGESVSGWTSPRRAVARHKGRLFRQVTIDAL